MAEAEASYPGMGTVGAAEVGNTFAPMGTLSAAGTNNALVVAHYAWAPDGSAVAFSNVFGVEGAGGVFRTDYQAATGTWGAPWRLVSEQAKGVAWYGNSILYANGPYIRKIAADVANQTPVTIVTGATTDNMFYPCWSPNGTHFVYVLLPGLRHGRLLPSEIYRAAADGSGKRNLTADTDLSYLANAWLAE